MRLRDAVTNEAIRYECPRQISEAEIQKITVPEVIEGVRDLDSFREMAKWVSNGVGQRKGIHETLPVFKVAVCKAIVVGIRYGLSVCDWVTNDDDNGLIKCSPGRYHLGSAGPIRGKNCLTAMQLPRRRPHPSMVQTATSLPVAHTAALAPHPPLLIPPPTAIFTTSGGPTQADRAAHAYSNDTMTQPGCVHRRKLHCKPRKGGSINAAVMVLWSPKSPGRTLTAVADG
ncbi:hypothetical protein BJY52DRAFT_1420971 [Lactarius psammicola]|nr:hypothetical protein BJY52DRAFT_1420971 [Lactarius psammicola]